MALINKSHIKELYYDEPLITMGEFPRFFTKLIVYSAYGIGVAATLTLVLSDINWLKDVGWIMVLFFADRLLDIGAAEKSFRLNPRGSVNVADYTTPATRNILIESFKRHMTLSGNLYLHILSKLLEKKEVIEIFTRLGVSVKELLSKLNESIKKSGVDNKPNHKESMRQMEDIMKRAFDATINLDGLYVEPRDVLAAIGSLNDPELTKILNMFMISADDLENAVIFSITAGQFKRLRRMPATLTGIAYSGYGVGHKRMNRAWTARPTPILDGYSKDLTDLARMEEVGFLVGHKSEYDRLSDVLSRDASSNALLVGEEGVGKEAIIAHLAFQIIRDKVPSQLFDKRLVQLNIGELVAGIDFAVLRDRVQKIVGEIISSGNIILYIPDLHQLITASGGGMLGVADILMPAIKNNSFPVIGATYPREYKEYILSRSDLSGLFEKIPVSEITPEEAMRILSYQGIILERQYKIMVNFSAIKKAVEVAHKYMGGKFLPGSAEILLREAFAEAKNKDEKSVTPEDVIAVAERKINIPIRAVDGGEAADLLDLESRIHNQFIDQEEAVTAVARALREYRSGLARQDGPIATFLFVGPTGVGKTELSKILADTQFGSREMMVRFDMSEFQEKNSLARLLGATDGSIGGVLADVISEKPFSLILLDEFEKAHPDILNVFLQIFDDGRLTDALGRVIDFKNTIIIATSNAHSDFIKNELEAGRDISTISSEMKGKLGDYFRPELLNRFSGIIVFKNLSPDHISQIAELQLRELASFVLENQGLEMIFTPRAVAEIARLGYDPVFGARPLRSVISDKIKSVLAEKILKKELARGSKVDIDFTGSDFIFI